MRIDSTQPAPAKGKWAPTPSPAPPPPPLPPVCPDRFSAQPKGGAVWTLSLDLSAGAGLGVTGSYQVHWDAKQVVVSIARSAGAYAGVGLGGILTIQRTDAPNVKALLQALGVTTAVTGTHFGVARLWAQGPDGKPITGNAVGLGGGIGIRIPTMTTTVGDTTVLAEWTRSTGAQGR